MKDRCIGCGNETEVKEYTGTLKVGNLAIKNVEANLCQRCGAKAYPGAKTE